MATFPLAEVAAAARQALALRVVGFGAVKHLLLCALDRCPPKLDLENYPHLPLAEVALTRAADYQALLSGAAAAGVSGGAPQPNGSRPITASLGDR